jgi:hypothetical protein
MLALAASQTPALADNMMDPWSQMLMKPMTPAETAQFKAERDNAKRKWAAMTPEEKASMKRSMRDKKLADLNWVERVAQNDDMTAQTKDESAQLKSERAAARSKYARMSDADKAALRKSAAQKKLGELSVMEQVAQENDMKRYMSY